jgi:tape measure domain-containing protein
MATNNQDVELRIRATNYSKQTTDKVVDSLKEMVKAQDAQIESAKKGATSVNQLEQSYTKLENAAKALLSQQSLIKLFQAQSASLVELEAKLAAARKAQTDYANSLTPGVARTAAQDKAMKDLGRTIASVEKQFERAQGRIDTTGKRLNEFGINAANMAAAQQKITTAVNSANDALGRQERAINGSDRAAASRKAAADAIAQRELQIRVDNQFAQAERDLARAIETEARAQREANQAGAMRNAQHLADMEQLFSRELYKTNEALRLKTAAIAAQQAALQAAATAAERLARSTTVASRGNGAQPVAGPNLAGAIRDIQNPAEAAVRSVAGIETAIAGLERRVTSIRGPVQDYRGAMDEAARAQRALLQVAGQVDAYQRQLTALRASRAEFQASRVAVNTLIAEMRSGAAGEDITTRLARAQSTLQQTAANMANVTNATRAAREALRTAGVDTANLTNAEASLVSQANRATTALNALTEAFRRNGGAADQAGSRILNWFGGANGRSTLSYAQRLRGEMLGLAAGFVGLNAAIGLSQETLKAYSLQQSTLNKLVVTTGGDTRKAADEYRYLQAASDRIGVSLAKVAPAYSKLAIAANMAGQTTAQTRYIFEGFATAISRLGLDGLQAERVFKALEQMFNKNKISAEELSSQLGDALPGAVRLFSQAMDVTPAKFIKLMEAGEVGPELIVKAAKALKETYSTINAGTENLSQAQARFENAQQRFLVATGKAGFVEAYQGLLNRLTGLMNDGTADKLAVGISAGFVAVIDVIQKVVDNFNALKVVIVAILGLKFVAWLASLPAIFRLVTAEVLLLNGGLLAMQARLNAASAAVALTAALGPTGLTGIAIRLAPALIAVGNALLFVTRAIPVIGAAILAYQATTAILDHLDDKVVQNVQRLSNATNKATEEAFATQTALERARGTKEESALSERFERQKKIVMEANAELNKAKAKAIADGVMLDKVKFSNERDRTGGTNNADTQYPGMTDGGPRQLEALRAELEKEMKTTERSAQNQRLKAAKGDLAARLDLIDMEYDERRTKAKSAFKNEADLVDALAAIDKASLAKQSVERAKYNNEQTKSAKGEGDKRLKLAADIKAELSKIEDDIANKNANADVTKPFEERRQARLKAIGNEYDKLAKKIRDEKNLNPKQAAEDDAKLKILTAQRVSLENQNSVRDEANRLVDEFNKKQSIMKSELEEVDALYKANLISQNESLTRANEIAAVSGNAVQVAGEEALNFATKFRSMMDPVVFQQAVATLRTGMAETQSTAMIAGNDLAAQQETMNKILADQAAAVELITLKRSMSMITSEEEAAMLNQTTAEYKDKIIANAEALLQLLEVARNFGAISEEAFGKAKLGADNLVISTKNAQLASSDLDRTIAGSIATNGVNAFERLGEEIGKVAAGAQSIGEGFKGALQAVGQFFAQLLRDIAMAIVKQMILNAISSYGGGIGAAGVALGGAIAGGSHNGGVVGSGSPTFSRRVDTAAFFGAPRYHTGGIAGFAPNEMPAILQKNEEVLTRDDPRHVLNGGGGKAGAEGGAGTRFVLVDDRNNVPQAMASSAGEKVIMAALKNNLPTVKQWVK